MTPTDLGRPVRYEFILAEQLSAATKDAFPELDESVAVRVAGTVLFGRVHDGPHLHGLLDRFQDLGLTVLEMRRLPD